MAYPFWKYGNYKSENTNPFRAMKDRDMTNVIVQFKRGPEVQGKHYYYFENIEQPSDKITLNYIANLAGRRGVTKAWTNKGFGGYVPYLTLDVEEFNIMSNEVVRLGGTVRLV